MTLMGIETEGEILSLAEIFTVASVNVRNRWQENTANLNATCDVEAFLDTFLDHVEVEFYTLLDTRTEEK